MSRTKKHLAVLLAVVMVLCLVPAMVFGAGDDGQVVRISGNDRYATSAETALEAFPDGAETVIIARGDEDGNFADGLAASFLAGVKDAPILLTKPNELPDVVKDAIIALGAENAIILGGPAVITNNVTSELTGLDVERVYGANRYETAAKIAAKGGSADTAFVVSGYAPADSLVAGPLAFSNGYPVLLADDNNINFALGAIDELGIKNIIVVGGTGVVTENVYNQLAAKVDNIARFGGQNRVETSLKVVELYTDPKDFSIVGYNGLADAVGAAVFGNPIIYVSGEDVSNIAELESVTPETNFFIFGGTGVVSGEVEAALGELLVPEVDKTALAEAIANAETLQEEDYTPDTWAVFADALEAAKAVLNDEEATQEDVDEAVANLNAAIEGLEEVLVVKSVSAINAKEVQIKFSKAVTEADVVTTGNLNTANLNVTPLTGAKTVAPIAAELSEDGKTLTLTAGTNYFDGQYAVVVEPTVTDLDGNAIKAYSEILTVKDIVRPTVTKVEYVDFQTAEVIFSEPLSSLGTAIPSLSDITVSALAADGKSVTIGLSNANVELNKEYTVTIIGAKDFAGNLITPNPTEITVKKVKADTVKPTVEAITVVNDKLFTIKFSEKLNAILPTVSVSNSTGATLTVTKDINDPTVYNVSSDNSLAGVSGAAIAKTVTVSNFTDLSGNTGDTFSKVVTFVADTTDPKVVSTRVEKINGVEHLIVTFDENVVPQNNVAINGKVVKDFVETDKTPAITTDTSTNFELYKPVNNKSKAVQLDLTSLSDGDYTLNLPVGLVKDEAGNDNEAKTVTFTRTSDVDVNKPALVAAYDGNGIKVDDNNTVTVKFDRKLDVASALNLNNYVIEGVQIKSAIFTANPDASGHAIVRLTLEDGSVTLSGDRAVTIKNVKSADGVVMDTVTTTEEFTENVRPTVKSAKLTAEDEITLTFSEKVKLGSSVDFDVFVGSETTARTITSTTLDPTDGESVVIKLTTALTADDLAKDIVVKKASTNDVEDDPAGNKLSFTSIVVTK